MSRRDELALQAIKKEHKRLSVVAAKAKAEADECMNIADEMVAIYNELSGIVSLKQYGDDVLKRLEKLKARRDKAEKVMEKDLVKLLEKQIKAERDRDDLGREIQMREFRLSRNNFISD